MKLKPSKIKINLINDTIEVSIKTYDLLNRKCADITKLTLQEVLTLLTNLTQ